MDVLVDGARRWTCTRTRSPGVFAGVRNRNAENIIAEIGIDMSRFPTAAHLASWAGMCPGNNESAGKRRSGKSRRGDPWLQSTLVEAGWAASRAHHTSMRARFYRISKRRGSERAVYAVGHHLLVVIWWMLSERVPYNEIGDDFQQRRIDPERRRRYLVQQLEQLGLEVAIRPAA